MQLAAAFVDIRARVDKLAGDLATVRHNTEKSVGQLTTLVGRAATSVSQAGAVAGNTAGLWARLKDSAAGVAVQFVGVHMAFSKVLELFRSTLRFQENMTHALSIQTGVTQIQRKEMEALAQTIAVDLAFPVEDLAKGFFELAQAGYTTDQQLKALPVTAKFARAGLMDVASATSLLNDAQKASGLFVEDATQNMLNLSRVADVISKASILSNADISEMARGVARAGSTVTAFGSDFEEMVATVAVFADVGRKSAAGGTASLIVLRELQETAIKNRDVWADMGITVFDAQGKFAGMADILAEMEKALGGMSDEVRRDTLRNALKIDDRSVQFLTSILGQSGRIRKFKQELKGAQGTTDEIATKQMAAFTRQLGKMVEQLKVAAINVLPGFIRPIIALLKPITYAIEKFAKFDTMAGNVASSLAGIAAFTKLAMIALERLGITGMVPLARMMGRFSIVLLRMGFGFIELFHKASVVGPVLEGIGETFANLLRGIPFIGGALGGLVSMFSNVASRLVGIPFGAIVAANLGTFTDGMYEAMNQSGIVRAFQENERHFAQFFKQLGRNIVLLSKQLFDVLAKIVSRVAEAFGLKGAGGEAKGFVETLGNMAKNAATILRVFADNWGDAWRFAENNVLAIFARIEVAFNSLVLSILHGIGEIIEALGEAVDFFSDFGITDKQKEKIGLTAFGIKMFGASFKTGGAAKKAVDDSEISKRVGAKEGNEARAAELRDAIAIEEHRLEEAKRKKSPPSPALVRALQRLDNAEKELARFVGDATKIEEHFKASREVHDAELALRYMEGGLEQLAIRRKAKATPERQIETLKKAIAISEANMETHRKALADRTVTGDRRALHQRLLEESQRQFTDQKVRLRQLESLAAKKEEKKETDPKAIELRLSGLREELKAIETEVTVSYLDRIRELLEEREKLGDATPDESAFSAKATARRMIDAQLNRLMRLGAAEINQRNLARAFEIDKIRQTRMVNPRHGRTALAEEAATGGVPLARSRIDLPVFSALDELQRQIQEQLAARKDDDKLGAIASGIDGVGRGIQEVAVATKQVVENTRRALPQGVSGVSPTPADVRLPIEAPPLGPDSIPIHRRAPSQMDSAPPPPVGPPVRTHGARAPWNSP